MLPGTDAHYASGSGSGSAYQHVGLSPLRQTHTTAGLHPTVPILTSLLSVAAHSKLCPLPPQCSYSLRATGERAASKVFAPVPCRPRMCGAWTMQQDSLPLPRCLRPLTQLSIKKFIYSPSGATSFGWSGSIKSCPVVAALGCRLCTAGTLK